MRAKIARASFPGAAIVLAALLLAIPCIAEAASLTIKPSLLQPYSSQQGSIQSAYYASGSAAFLDFWYPLALPVGTVITGLRYQHASLPGNLSAVGIARAKPDAASPFEFIYAGASDVATVTAFEFINVNAVLVSGAVNTVEAGWRYGVVVKTSGMNSSVGKITVFY